MTGKDNRGLSDLLFISLIYLSYKMKIKEVFTLKAQKNKYKQQGNNVLQIKRLN